MYCTYVKHTCLRRKCTFLRATLFCLNYVENWLHECYRPTTVDLHKSLPCLQHVMRKWDNGWMAYYRIGHEIITLDPTLAGLSDSRRHLHDTLSHTLRFGNKLTHADVCGSRAQNRPTAVCEAHWLRLHQHSVDDNIYQVQCTTMARCSQLERGILRRIRGLN
jgi:hypothetical protein